MANTKLRNTEIVEELRKLSGSIGNDLSTEAAIRLTLGALVDLNDNLECSKAETGEAQQKLLEAQQSQTKSVDQLLVSINLLASEVNTLKSMVVDNPIISFGKHLREHPKLTYLYLAIGFILFNIWLLPEFRAALLSLIGISKDIFSVIP